MADPFEIRQRFTAQLQNLNASVSSAQKAAFYALRFKDQDEDLHACILEQLQKSNLNTRANIMYFIEQLCELSQRDGHNEFIKMIRRDIYAIVDAVAPDDQGGAANVKVVQKVLTSMGKKHYLLPGAVIELEASLKDREGAAVEEEDVTMGDALSAAAEDGKEMAKGGEGLNGPLKLGTVGRPEKRHVEQRLEEDRERHKRLKESIWEVSGHADDEFEKMWEETSELGDDDYVRAEEEAEERRKCFELEAVEARDAGKA